MAANFSLITRTCLFCRKNTFKTLNDSPSKWCSLQCRSFNIPNTKKPEKVRAGTFGRRRKKVEYVPEYGQDDTTGKSYPDYSW